MSRRKNTQNIDRKTNKPNPKRTEGITPDVKLVRGNEIRRDDDVIRTPTRSIYDIDYAIMNFLKNEVVLQITHDKEIIPVPVIYANGETWDNVRRLGFLRDEKGKLQSPLLIIKRNSFTERDTKKGLDVNRNMIDNFIIGKRSYNTRNRYNQNPFPFTETGKSNEHFLITIPKYISVSYDLMLWTDFSTQMNELVEQIYVYNRMAWGTGANRYITILDTVSYETVNTIGEDRLVRATIPITVNGHLMPEHEFNDTTLKKMYSPKILNWSVNNNTINELFSSTYVPSIISNILPVISTGGTVTVGNANISNLLAIYLITITERIGTIANQSTVQISALPAINPFNGAYATKNEFDIYINGQYIDKPIYDWTPGANLPQMITFNTSSLGYVLSASDIVIVKGRWA